MEWAHFQHEIGYCFDYPAGWQVKVSELAATCTVTSPDGLWSALIQPTPFPPGQMSPSDAIKFMLVFVKDSFPQARVEEIKPDSNSAEATISYRAPDGSPGRAMWVFMQGLDGGALYSAAAPAATFDAATPTLARIIRSQNEAMRARNKSPAPQPVTAPTPPAPTSPAPASVPPTSAAPTSRAPTPVAPTPPKQTPMAPTPVALFSAALQRSFRSIEQYIRSKQPPQRTPPAPTPPLAPLSPLTSLPPLPGYSPTPPRAPLPPLAPLATLPGYSPPPPVSSAQIQYAQFTDPQRGSFTVDAPVGWRVSGGLKMVSVGDCRPWFEVSSPDGIYLLADPEFPRSVCHMWLGWSGWTVSVGAGGQFMCIKPTAEKSADCYLSKLGAKRLPKFIRVARRPRPDIADWVRKVSVAAGIKAGRKSRFEAIETTLERKQAGVVASLLTTCAFDGTYDMIGFAFWQTCNIVCISPAHLASRADTVRSHMLMSLSFTPVMQQISQQVTAQTNANAQAMNAAQWANFNNMQAAHRAQTAMGDAIVSNYWDQQKTNDSIMSGWEQNQAVYDQLSQQRSDAMMDRQRLSDDAAGKTYDATAGSNYYWRDEQTGNVIGTTTDQPPDYQNNYTQLRKL